MKGAALMLPFTQLCCSALPLSPKEWNGQRSQRMREKLRESPVEGKPFLSMFLRECSFLSVPTCVVKERTLRWGVNFDTSTFLSSMTRGKRSWPCHSTCNHNSCHGQKEKERERRGWNACEKGRNRKTSPFTWLKLKRSVLRSCEITTHVFTTVPCLKLSLWGVPSSHPNFPVSPNIIDIIECIRLLISLASPQLMYFRQIHQNLFHAQTDMKIHSIVQRESQEEGCGHERE